MKINGLLKKVTIFGLAALSALYPLMPLRAEETLEKKIQPTYLTETLEADEMISWSSTSFFSNGGCVLYRSTRKGEKAHMSLWTMNSDGGNKTPLSNGNYNNCDPDLSLDGEYTVFISDRNLIPEKMELHVYVRDMTIGIEKKLLDYGRTEIPKFTRDGKNIVFFFWPSLSELIARESWICMMDSDRVNPQESIEKLFKCYTSNDSFLFSSPYTNHMVYSALPSQTLSCHTKLYILDTDTKKVKRLTKNPDNATENFPVFLPDGRVIFMMNFPTKKNPGGHISYQSNLYIINIDGTNQKPLKEGDGIYAHPVVSPDGKYVAFISNENRKRSLKVMDMDRGKEGTLLETTTLEGSVGSCPLAFSPNVKNGTYELFLSLHRNNNLDMAKIYFDASIFNN